MNEIQQPFRGLIPPLSEAEFAELEKSILAEGCRDALVLWDDKLLDGHNRLQICKKHGLPYKTITLEFENEVSAKVWILRNQLGRRNLPLYEKAKVVLQLEDVIREQAKQRQREGGKQKVVQNSAQAGKARDELAKLAGVSHDTIARVKVIEEKGTEEQKDKLRRGETTINRAYKNIRRQQGMPTAKPTPPLPEGVYDVIYADPPWCYEFSETNCRRIENQYPTMPIEEICRLRIPAADNAVLFLWATAPKYEEALQVLNAWGFTYRTCAVWDKEKMGMGYWFRGQHELILVGVRGDFHPPEPEARVPSVIRQLRTEHSRKPDIVYEIIERMFPAGKYLELFSRSKRDGWTMWGLNE